MKVNLSAAFAAVSVLSCATSSASAADVKGLGSSSCYDIVSLWNRSAADTRDIMLMSLGQWSFGYFSGRNQELSASYQRSLAGLDNNRTAAVIVDVCSRNQNLYVYQVADAIFQALPYGRGTS